MGGVPQSAGYTPHVLHRRHRCTRMGVYPARGYPPIESTVGLVRAAGNPSGAARGSPDARCAKTIENISRIRMVVARASGTLMASSLKPNKFLTLELHPGGLVHGSGAPFWCAEKCGTTVCFAGTTETKKTRDTKINVDSVLGVLYHFSAHPKPNSDFFKKVVS